MRLIFGGVSIYGALHPDWRVHGSECNCINGVNECRPNICNVNCDGVVFRHFVLLGWGLIIPPVKLAKPKYLVRGIEV